MQYEYEDFVYCQRKRNSCYGIYKFLVYRPNKNQIIVEDKDYLITYWADEVRKATYEEILKYFDLKINDIQELIDDRETRKNKLIKSNQRITKLLKTKQSKILGLKEDETAKAVMHKLVLSSFSRISIEVKTS